MRLVAKLAEVRYLAERQDVPNGAVPACQWCLSDVDDVIAVNGKATRRDDTSGITHIKAVDISRVGWRFAEDKDTTEIGAIGPESTARSDEVIKLAAVVGKRV